VEERGSSGSEACAEAEESNGSPNQPMMCATFSRISSLGGSFPTVRATVVGQDTERNTVLAGDPKMFRLLCNTNLNMIHT